MATSRHGVEVFSSLESLRGVAALAVVLYHAPLATLLTDLAAVRNAYLMVDFFFVLSGFVIAHSYGDRIASIAHVLRFMWLRLGRLYPLHLFMLLVYLGIEVLKYLTQVYLHVAANTAAFAENDLASFGVNVLLLQSFGVADYHTWNIASWSISVEFYMYALFAALALLFAAGRGRFMLLISPLIALAGIAYLATCGHLARFQEAHALQYVDVLRGVAGFFLGVFACGVRRWLSGTRAAPMLPGWSILPALLAAAAAIALLSAKDRLGVADVALYPLFAILVLALSLAPRDRGLNRVLNTRPLLWLGQVSYSIYMTHQAIYWFVRQGLRVGAQAPLVESGDRLVFALPAWSAHLLLLAVVATVLLCAHATFRLIEDPYRRKSRTMAGRLFRAPEPARLSQQPGA